MPQLDQSGYDYWMGHLNKGVSREYVFRGFAEGVEFEALCRSFGIMRGNVTLAQNRDQNPDVTAFVSRLYQTTLDRRGDELGLNDWTGRLLSGQSTGAQIIDGFFCSNEDRPPALRPEHRRSDHRRLFLLQRVQGQGHQRGRIPQ